MELFYLLLLFLSITHTPHLQHVSMDSMGKGEDEGGRRKKGWEKRFLVDYMAELR